MVANPTTQRQRFSWREMVQKLYKVQIITDVRNYDIKNRFDEYTQIFVNDKSYMYGKTTEIIESILLPHLDLS
jgi:hypothetical protein